MIKKHWNKVYIRIPLGEIQYGLVTKRLVIRFRGKVYTLKKSKYEGRFK